MNKFLKTSGKALCGTATVSMVGSMVGSAYTDYSLGKEDDDFYNNSLFARFARINQLKYDPEGYRLREIRLKASKLKTAEEIADFVSNLPEHRRFCEKNIEFEKFLWDMSKRSESERSNYIDKYKELCSNRNDASEENERVLNCLGLTEDYIRAKGIKYFGDTGYGGLLAKKDFKKGIGSKQYNPDFYVEHVGKGCLLLNGKAKEVCVITWDWFMDSTWRK